MVDGWTSPVGALVCRSTMTWVTNGLATLGRVPSGWVAGGLLLGAFGFGCSGQVETIGPEEMGSGGVIFVITGGAPSATGGAEASGGMSETGGQMASGGRIYMEPECPDEPPPPIEEECDPLAEEDECGEGFGCFPFLQYPNGEECGDPQYGAFCAFAGDSVQGEPCADGLNSCAPGFMCILGAAGGKRCAKICEPTVDHMCPGGLICGLTDVQGYGVCY